VSVVALPQFSFPGFQIPRDRRSDISAAPPCIAPHAMTLPPITLNCELAA
jgi:hypothetical protein